MEVGTRVRVVEDEWPEMVGLEGTIIHISRDGTAATVEFGIPVLCAICNLEEINDTETT